jgi:hypothetical protein
MKKPEFYGLDGAGENRARKSKHILFYSFGLVASAIF